MRTRVYTIPQVLGFVTSLIPQPLDLSCSFMHSHGVRREVDEAVAVAAGARAGAFCFSDVRAAGGDRWLARRRVAAGRWVGPPGGPWVLAGTPASLDQRRHLALLTVPASRLTHESAAELARLDGVVRGRIVLSVSHDRRYVPPKDVIVHRVDDLRPSHLSIVGGFPTTTVPRTIVDLAGVTSPLRLKRAVESTVTDRKASFSRIALVLRQVRRQGKPGVTRLVRVLDELDGEPPPGSVLERHLVGVVRLVGLDAVRQFPLPWEHEPVVGCVDIAIPTAKVIVEADGRRWHARLDAMANDRRRDRAALRAGWITVRFVYKDLVDDPRGSATELAAIVAGRLR